jgi:2-hydroxychromene-2-carboxylate isomerase
MTRTVEFLFDFGSPTTYLAHKRIPAITARSGIKFDYVPILLGGVFKATGNASPVTVPAKGRYMNADMGRYAAKYGVPLAMNPFFPINTISLMRGAVGYRGRPQYAAYIDAVFDAMWQKPVNMGDPEIVAATLSAAGFDPAEFAALIADEGVKEALKSNTEAAVSKGVFGAPTFFVGEDMFFGQDRLDWVEEAALA